MRAINKYGIENFIFEIIELCTIEQLDNREIFWIKFYHSCETNRGYNVRPGGADPFKTHKGCAKPVRAFLLNEEDEIIKNSAIDFSSGGEAARILSEMYNTPYCQSTINLICNGKQYKHKFHTFCFIDKDGENVPTNYIKKYGTSINIITPDDEILSYLFVKDAERAFDIDKSTFFRALKRPDHRITKGKLKNYRVYYQNDTPILPTVHNESLKDLILSGTTKYKNVYEVILPNGEIEYFSTLGEICEKYSINRTVIQRNYGRVIGRGKFKGFQINKIEVE